MYISRAVETKIKSDLKSTTYETGGILGGSVKCISCYKYDSGVKKKKYCYLPDIVMLNRTIYDWATSGKCFLGIVHSHIDSPRLSYADIEFARKIIDLNKISKIFMMLYVIRTDEIILFQVDNAKIQKESLYLEEGKC